MQTSPATQSTPKLKRAKAEEGTAETGGTKKPARTRKKTASPAVEPILDIEVVALYPSPDEVTGMIATTAYFIAAERHFAAGHELDDWLEAERRIRAQFPSA